MIIILMFWSMYGYINTCAPWRFVAVLLAGGSRLMAVPVAVRLWASKPGCGWDRLRGHDGFVRLRFRTVRSGGSGSVLCNPGIPSKVVRSNGEPQGTHARNQLDALSITSPGALV